MASGERVWQHASLEGQAPSDDLPSVAYTAYFARATPGYFAQRTGAGARLAHAWHVCHERRAGVSCLAWALGPSSGFSPAVSCKHWCCVALGRPAEPARWAAHAPHAPHEDLMLMRWGAWAPAPRSGSSGTAPAAERALMVAFIGGGLDRSDQTARETPARAGIDWVDPAAAARSPAVARLSPAVRDPLQPARVGGVWVCGIGGAESPRL
jgi:hypothetical protein